MKNRIGKISVAFLFTAITILLVANLFVAPLVARPITPKDTNARLGAFTGPENGSSQDDNIKASLDLAHTDLDSILANQASTGTLIAGQTYVRTKAAVNTGSTDDLFLVVGYIQITNFFGEITTLFGGSPGTMVIELDSVDADYDSDFSTTVNVDAAAEGDWIKFSNVIDESVLSFAANTSAMPAINWLCSPGMIEQTLSSTGTGATTWYMTFIPLTSGVTVTAQ